MTTTPAATAGQPKKIALYTVHRSLQWQGKRYSPEKDNRLALTAADLEHEHVRAWVTHQWISADAPAAKASPAKGNGRESYEVLQRIAWHGVTREAGDVIDFAVKGSHANRDRWLKQGKIRKVPERPTWEEAAAEPRTPAAATAVPIPQTVSAEIVRQVPWMRIQPSRYNPRQDFTETPAAAAAMAELVESIKAQGIIQPLIVRPASPLHPDGPHTPETVLYELVAGERRWRAAGQVGLETVPCLVRDLAKQQAIEQQALENIQRQDLNRIEEGQGYQTLMDEAGLTVPEICRKTGKSEATIYSRLKLLECPPGLRKAVIDGRVSGSTADLVVRLDKALQFAAMDAILHPEGIEGEEGGVLSFRQTKRWIEDHRAGLEREAAWQKTAHASDAAKAAGARVLTAEESARVVIGASYVRDSQAYVKPTAVCYDDPDHRTYAEIAEAAGRTLPAPVIARAEYDGNPVVLLPRPEVEQLLADQIPNAAEQKRRREEADQRRRQEQAEAEVRREETVRQVQARAVAVVHEVRTRRLDGDDEEALLRFAVGARLGTLAEDEDDLAAALRGMGVPVEESEKEAVATPEWRQEYLRGCDAQVLHAWLVWFAIHEADFYAVAIDEDRLHEAEILLGLREDPPRTSAVAEGEEEEATTI